MVRCKKTQQWKHLFGVQAGPSLSELSCECNSPTYPKTDPASLVRSASSDSNRNENHTPTYRRSMRSRWVEHERTVFSRPGHFARQPHIREGRVIRHHH